MPGVVVTGRHTLTVLDGGPTRLDLGAEGSGPLAFLTDLLTGRRVRKYVALEAAGIKAAAEAAEGHSPA